MRSLLKLDSFGVRKILLFNTKRDNLPTQSKDLICLIFRDFRLDHQIQNSGLHSQNFFKTTYDHSHIIGALS
jgi:hypothetical protein